MRKRFFQVPQKKTPHLFWFLLWWNQIRIRHQLQCLISNPIWISLFLPPMEFYIRLLFSDLKPSGFFDLPNIVGGNNFHQINRRNLLILPRRRLWGGKPPPPILWHSISFILFPDFFHYIPWFLFILDFSNFFWNGISWFYPVTAVSSRNLKSAKSMEKRF